MPLSKQPSFSCTNRFWSYVATMDWQQLAALAIVGITTALLLWSRFRPRRFSFERNTHCGCAASWQAPQHSIVFRARKGERPRVIVKMK
jgi:hypothetical protein